MPEKKVIKIARTIGFAVLLGAIGSGVWARVLSPIWDLFTTFFVSTISKTSSSYSNSIYLSATNPAPLSKPAMFDLNINTMLLGMILFVIWVYLPRNNAPLSRLTRKPMYIMAVVIALTWAILFTPSLASISSHKIRRYSIKTMTILRPYIGDSVFHQLNSDFYSIQNKDDFIQFQDRIIKLANENSFELEEFIAP